MSVTCSNCGRLNRPGARYCASCQTVLAEAAVRLQPGHLLDGGTYRVLRPLGKGGMGAVWLVAQTKAFDRLAVVKEVIDYFDPTDPAERLKASERFEAEARTLGSLKHPGIPDLYAYFSEGGHNYLVMEYIEGPDLRMGLTREDSATGQLVPGSPFPADDVLRYAIQVCEVLEYLAKLQPPVVHNDIKPGNIIIDSHSGRAVLVDFGTAKTRYLRPAGGPDQKRDSIYGTVGYAAPELYRGLSESRSDVYSLAATTYHLLTDDDPRDHPFKYPKLGTLPGSLAGILRRALAEELKDRPQAGQFRQELEAFLAGQSGPLRALTFPDGDAADSLEALLRLAVKHWRYAGGLILDGTLARWLRGTLRDAQAAGIAEAAASSSPADGDAALDYFIRQVAPGALPPGNLEVRTTSLRLAGVRPGQRLSQAIEIANRGHGFLRGEVISSQRWLVLTSPSFGCPPGSVCAIPFQIDATGLAPGQVYLAALTLVPAGGDPEVIPVQIAVQEAQTAAPVGDPDGVPAIRVQPDRVDFGSVSRNALYTGRKQLSVTNVGSSPARCRVVGAPAWLLIKPEAFAVMPGDQQPVDLVGRVSKIPGRRQRSQLSVAVDGGGQKAVEVSVRIRGGSLFG